MELYDGAGKRIDTAVPNPLTGTFCREAHRLGPTKMNVVDPYGNAAVEVKHELVRAQQPYLVTLLITGSRFQMQSTQREYFVYAPADLASAAKLAVRLWRRWEKAPRDPDAPTLDMNDDYPKVKDAVLASPIDDNFFKEMWRHARQRPHRTAGHPEDPFAFTCLDQDVRVHKISDFQEGFNVTV
jgi:hypothetical protein